MSALKRNIEILAFLFAWDLALTLKRPQRIGQPDRGVFPPLMDHIIPKVAGFLYEFGNSNHVAPLTE
jgi:hypothetical protein